MLVGLLDELEQQAQQRQASVNDAQQHKAQRDEVFRTQLEPAITALYEYLKKLVANLKILQPKKLLSYPLNGYGDIVGYIEHDYDLKLNQQPGSKEVVLVFSCAVASEECPTIEVQGAGKVRTVASVFQRYHLGGMQNPRKDITGAVNAATFKAKGKIVLSANFGADGETNSVKMNFVNFDGLGTAAKNLPPAQLNEAMFDEIGRYLTFEPSTLFREALPDDYRKQLRTRVQQEQIKRRWESKISANQKTELDQLKREQSIGSKLGKLVGKDKPAEAEAGGSSWLQKLKGLVKK